MEPYKGKICKLCGHGVRDYTHSKTPLHKKYLFEIMKKKKDDEWLVYFDRKIKRII